MKTCKVCKVKFEPERPMQTTCSYQCAIKHANEQKQKDGRKKLKAFNDSDISVLKRKAQQAFNAYIRWRDRELSCVSCGYEGTGRVWHASHYRPATNSKLRFDERNVHKSCSICNTHLSGNLAEYRKKLIEKIGLDQVEELESTNGPYRYTVEELKEIIKTSKEKTK